MNEEKKRETSVHTKNKKNDGARRRNKYIFHQQRGSNQLNQQHRQHQQYERRSAVIQKHKTERNIYLPDVKKDIDNEINAFTPKYLKMHSKRNESKKINIPEKIENANDFDTDFHEFDFEERKNKKDSKNTGSKKQESDRVPELKDENIRIIPLGGVEEIGRNMYVVEYKNDIVILDAGFQFNNNDTTPGIDYIIPNISYLEKRKHKIRGLIITHGHLDHIGAIPYIMSKIGNPTIYSRLLTTLMIKKRQSEFPDEKELNIKIIEDEEVIKMGDLKVRFFSVTHTVPDSVGVIIETPHGIIVNPGDFKLDHINEKPTEEEEERYKFFEKEKVLFAMIESTNIENPGFSTPEKIVHQDLEKIIKAVNGRLIIGMFSSHIERMAKVIEVAEKYGKKIIIEGRSMKDNISIVKEAGLLKVNKETIITLEEANKIPENKTVVLATGAQGDEFAALMRMSTGEHKLKLNKNDTVVLSSSIVPGNEIAVQKLKDNLARHRVKIMHYRTSDLFVHSTGHGNYGEIEWLHKKLKPKFFMPIHGTHYMLRLHAGLAESLGMKEDQIVVPDNGTIIEIREGGNKMVVLKEKTSSSIMMVDGFAIGNMQDVVIRDRQLLAEDGIFIIVATINARTGKLRKSPDIISRGFVYLRESQELLQQTRLIIKRIVEEGSTNMYPINFDYIKTNITDGVRKFLLQQTAKKPLVIPVVLAV